MSVTYDYTDYVDYAATYENRPDYAPQAIEAALRVAGVTAGDRVTDIGAGSGHLTIPLLEHGLVVDAVEPTTAMREIGQRRTADHPGVTWHIGQGEATGRAAGAYRLAAFGSSFDRTNQQAALRESARILAPGGYFLCCWNHRDLTDPLQQEIERFVTDRIPDYRYGLRRSDPTPIIDESGLFEPVVHLAGSVVHEVDATVWQEAWRSHMTLGTQAGDRFDEILAGIEALARARYSDRVRVPYTTRVWVARLRKGAGDAG